MPSWLKFLFYRKKQFYFKNKSFKRWHWSPCSLKKGIHIHQKQLMTEHKNSMPDMLRNIKQSFKITFILCFSCHSKLVAHVSFDGRGGGQFFITCFSKIVTYAHNACTHIFGYQALRNRCAAKFSSKRNTKESKFIYMYIIQLTFNVFDFNFLIWNNFIQSNFNACYAVVHL